MRESVPTNVKPFPAITPGHRLAPAKIGRKEAHQIVYIECPNWCVVDHVEWWQAGVEDVTHSSADASVESWGFDAGNVVHVLGVTIKTDPAADDIRMRQAHIVLDDESDMAFLTPEMAEQFADSLIGFASEIRHMARSARLHNQSAGDSDPDMDEALRRVRDGRTA